MSTLSTITHQKKLIKKDTGFSPVSYFAITDDIYASDGITNTMHNFATIETTLIASKAYAIGEFLVYGGILYKITTAITNGGTIIISPTSGYNVIQDNIGNEITALKNNVNIKVNSYDATNKILYLVSVI